MSDSELPTNLEEYIADITSRPGIPVHQRAEIANEIRDHFHDVLEEDCNANTEKLIEEFGRADFVGALVARAAQRRDGGHTMRIIGLLTSLLLVGFAISIGPGGLGLFINIPSIIFVGGLGCAFGVLAWGPKIFFTTYLTVFGILAIPRTARIPSYATRVISGHITQVYGAGLIGFFVGLVHMLASLDDVSAIGSSLAVMLLTLFYSVCIAEGILRPALRAIEFTGADGDQGAIA